MHLLTASITLAATIFSTSAKASYQRNDLSFGTNDRISLKGNSIPNFQALGSPNPPEFLSNKVVLTPPAPGNARGAIWSEKTLDQRYWAIDVDFRVTGPERGGGNIQIWYVKNGQQNVGTSSIYTVGNFDGLALTVDQYAGSGGSIRGFLNDGTTDYKSHHSVDSLAFGRCDYPYRNLGRPLRIHIAQIDSGFVVLVDGKECFASTKIILPGGNNIGITSASTETPDSVEIFKLITRTDTHSPSGEEENIQSEGSPKISQQVPDASAQIQDDSSTLLASAEQFTDLHFRLQSMMKQMNRLNQVIAAHQSQYMAKYDELILQLRGAESLANNIDSVSNTLESVRTELLDMKHDIYDALDKNFQKLKGDVRITHNTVLDTHDSLHDKLLGLASFSKIVFLLLGSQAILVFGFIMYKRQKGRIPKKYL